MVIFAFVACALCCAVWTMAVILFTRNASPGAPVPVAVAPPREEDLVRPAVDASGQPIWVAADELFWHEIVSWPPRRAAVGERRTSVS